MSLLTVENLGKSFGGVRAIEGVSFAIPGGAVHSIIGPNGAGKTTLLNLITGLYVPDRGSIRFEGRELAAAPAHTFAAAGIGRTFQNLQVFFNMTALENVMTGRHLLERDAFWATLLHAPSLVRSEAATRARALELLACVDLVDWADEMADAMQLSASTVDTELRFAKAWLRTQLEPDS